MWKFQWSFKQGPLVIQFVHGRTSYDTAVMLFRGGGGGGEGVKGKAVYDALCFGLCKA